MTLRIACDEAGHTGPDLLSPEQRIFAYASVNISDEEAAELIAEARSRFPVQMPELKATKLLKTTRGRALVAFLIQSLEGRFAINAHDKLVALCGWIFEYIYEPVVQNDPDLLYEKNLHRFVAMFSWMWFHEQGSNAETAVQEFQAYMRTRDPTDAPLFFQNDWPTLEQNELGHPFELVLRFASGYRDIIAADNRRAETALPDGGTWLLDLSASALWSHLNHWGRQDQPLDVRCDVSKPLQASISAFRGDERDPAIMRARQMGRAESLGWVLKKPIEFVDSKDHPAVQLADILAGFTMFGFSNDMPADLVDISSIGDDAMLRDSIFPDFSVIDLSQRAAAVNFLALYDLAKRAEVSGHPTSGLAQLYRTAEMSWARDGSPFA